MNTVPIVRRSLNPRLELEEGVLLTMFDGRTNLALQVAEEVKHSSRQGLCSRSITPKCAAQRGAQPRKAHHRLRPFLPGCRGLYGSGR